MEQRQPTMLGGRAKKSYQLLVREYKYMNNTVRIEDFLENIFNRALVELKSKQYSVCGEAETYTRITLNQTKFRDVFDKRHSYNSWNDNIKQKYKIPLEEFQKLIIDVFDVSSRDVINKHKKSLLESLNLKQIRKSNHYYIVHLKYKDSDLILKNYNDRKQTTKNKYEQIVQIVKSEKGLAVTDLVDYISGDEDLKKMINTSKELTFDEITQKLIIRDYSYIDDTFFTGIGK